VTSHGQRFRRRALRRGYKVDEVDVFLDRVEATLGGGPVDTPVAAQEVHDVVFRVRFGGYDEWQVDLHLDRVERQLAEIEERGGFPPRGPEPRGPEPRLAPPPVREERMPAPDRMGPPMGGPPIGGPPMGGPPDRMGPPMGAPPMREERVPPPMPSRPGPPMTPPGPPPMPAPTGPPRDSGFGRYDESTFAGPSFDGFEQGRHGKTDMTAEIRMGGDPGAKAPPGAGPGASAPSDLQRIDQLRRTFQPRRFGSGYDPAQVDRLFDAVISAMSGRSPVAVNEAELDSSHFSLVPGGYFEAEVDAALREVREIMRRR
jgi:DivIVA domain-containing protein